MSGDKKPQSDQAVTDAGRRQPIFLLPTAVVILCGILLAIQLADSLVFNDSVRELELTWLAFVPFRLIAPEAIPGGFWPLLWTPFTHAFLHAGWEHVGFNTVWLAIFATPVTQRYGAMRMLILFLVGAAAGAAAFAATTLDHVQVLVGASGGIAALTGAAVRFIFQPPIVAVDPETGERRLLGRRLASFRDLLANPTARFFSIVWIVLNGIVPLLPMVIGSEMSGIAWQAHLGGFFAGLLLVPLLERKSP